MEQSLLNVSLENLRGKINTAISEGIMEYGLPAFLVAGVLADILLEVKRQEKIELVNSFNEIYRDLEKKIEELEKQENKK